MRTRGEWVCGLDSTQAPGIAVLISIGLILVPEGTSTTVLWDPFNDPDAPWFWTDCATLMYDELVTDVISNQLAHVRRVVDSKAMRRVRNREVQLVVTNTTFGSAAGVNLAIAGRFLAGT